MVRGVSQPGRASRSQPHLRRVALAILPPAGQGLRRDQEEIEQRTLPPSSGPCGIPFGEHKQDNQLRSCMPRGCHPSMSYRYVRFDVRGSRSGVACPAPHLSPDDRRGRKHRALPSGRVLNEVEGVPRLALLQDRVPLGCRVFGLRRPRSENKRPRSSTEPGMERLRRVSKAEPASAARARAACSQADEFGELSGCAWPTLGCNRFNRP